MRQLPNMETQESSNHAVPMGGYPSLPVRACAPGIGSSSCPSARAGALSILWGRRATEEKLARLRKRGDASRRRSRRGRLRRTRSFALTTDSETVKLTAAPSVALASDTLSVGGSSSVITGGGGGSSSSMMVPVAIASASVAFVGLDNVSVKVSSCSSLVVSTLTVCDVSLAANVSVPLVAVK